MIAVPHSISPQDYLDLDRQNPIRHEYRQGLVYAMTSGSDTHSRITINLLSLLNLHLDETPCRLYNGDVKVNYQDDFYYYPDAFVTCDERDRQDWHIKHHPKLIVEVLSKSTRDFDQGVKFNDNQQIEKLEEYVFIEQEEQRVECRRRQSDKTWEMVTYTLGDRVQLQSINLELAIA